MKKTNKTATRCFVLGAVLALTAGFSTTSMAANMHSKTDEVLTKDVVVTATKTKAKVRLVPQAVEIITAKDIEAIGATNVDDVMQYALSLNIIHAVHGDALAIRGMASNQTLFLIDGQRIAQEDTGDTMNGEALKRLNVSEIERIEIVRGPGSSLYGSEAMGGVINIITKKSHKAGVQFGLGYGTKRNAGFIRVDFGKHNHFSGSLDAHFEKVLREVEFKDRGGTRHNYRFKGNYDFDNAAKQQLQIELHRMDSNLVEETDLFKKPNSRKSEHTGKVTSDSRFTNKEQGGSISFTGKTASNEYMIRAYTNRLTKHQLTRGTLADKPELGLVPGDIDAAKYKTTVFEVRNTSFINDDHNITFGFEHKKQSYAGTRLMRQKVEGPSLTKELKEYSTKSYALYIEDQWQVSDRLFLLPSLRYGYDYQYGAEVTPKLGLTYDVNKIWKLKANYGKGFKAPTISELYMNWVHGGYMGLLGNPDLKPEHSRSYDVSLEGDNGSMFAKFTYFNNDVSNLISFKPIRPSADMVNPPRWLYQYHNVGSAQINGIEIELGTHLSKYLTARLQYNWNDATDKKSKTRLLGRAEEETGVQLRYDDHGVNPLQITLSGKYVKNYIVSGRQGDVFFSYPTIDLGIHKTWNKQMSVYMGVDNLFNKKEEDLYIRGRSYRMTVDWKL